MTRREWEARRRAQPDRYLKCRHCKGVLRRMGAAWQHAVTGAGERCRLNQEHNREIVIDWPYEGARVASEMDRLGVPTVSENGEILSLWGRVERALDVASRGARTTPP